MWRYERGWRPRRWRLRNRGPEGRSCRGWGARLRSGAARRRRGRQPGARSLTSARPSRDLGPWSHGCCRVPRLVRPVRRLVGPEPRLCLRSVAHPDAPIRAAAARIHALGAEVGVVAVAGGRVPGPALALILRHDVLPDPVNADGGVEQGGETVLVCRDERSRADEAPAGTTCRRTRATSLWPGGRRSTNYSSSVPKCPEGA